MIKYKTPDELKIMQQGGEIASGALREVLGNVRPGVSLQELDKVVENYIVSHGAQPAFKFVEDYRYSTCINVNDGIVHGIPNDYQIKRGDVVSVDLGVLYKDFNTDLSYTVEVETELEKDFLTVGRKALFAGIEKCLPGSKIGDVSHSMQKVVEKAGYSVSTMLVGHGIGRALHEDPYVPCYGEAGTGHDIKTGMALAIEIIYQKGAPKLEIDPADGWTIRTADGTLSGLFECTVGVLEKGNILITRFD